jgi:hypothetical protein
MGVAALWVAKIAVLGMFAVGGRVVIYAPALKVPANN